MYSSKYEAKQSSENEEIPILGNGIVKNTMGLSAVGNVIVTQLGKNTHWIMEKGQISWAARNFSELNGFFQYFSSSTGWHESRTKLSWWCGLHGEIKYGKVCACFRISLLLIRLLGFTPAVEKAQGEINIRKKHIYISECSGRNNRFEMSKSAVNTDQVKWKVELLPGWSESLKKHIIWGNIFLFYLSVLTSVNILC